MKPSSRIIKETARTQLKNHWVQAIFVTLVLLAVVLFVQIFSSAFFYLFKRVVYSGTSLSAVGIVLVVVCSLFSLCLVIPVFQGTVRWFWFLGIDKVLPIQDIFYYYSEVRLFVKALAVNLQLAARVVITVILCCSPATIGLRAAEALEKEFKYIAKLVSGFSFFLLLAGVLLALKLVSKYLIIPALLAAKEELDINDITTISKIITFGKNGYMPLVASFIGWIILSFLGVTLLYTVPYFLAAYVVFARFTITNHRFEAARHGINPLV